MKKIVTHINPDLDAISSVWLLKRFLSEWEGAGYAFVPAGATYNDKPVDSDSDIMHVDTGLGQLDHHQRVGVITSAAELTWKYVQRERKHQPISELDREAITRLVAVINLVDNARDLSWPEAGLDRYEFYLHSLIYGLKRNVSDDRELTDQTMIILDALLRSFKDKIRAEETLKEEGLEFETPWGKGVAIRTGNEKILWEAEIRGFVVVVKFDPRYKTRVKIYSRYDSKTDLTKAYKRLKKIDAEADWFLHASKKLLLISSHPEANPTSLTMEQIVDLLEKR